MVVGLQMTDGDTVVRRLGSGSAVGWMKDVIGAGAVHAEQKEAALQMASGGQYMGGGAITAMLHKDGGDCLRDTRPRSRWGGAAMPQTTCTSGNF